MGFKCHYKCPHKREAEGQFHSTKDPELEGTIGGHVTWLEVGRLSLDEKGLHQLMRKPLAGKHSLSSGPAVEPVGQLHSEEWEQDEGESRWPRSVTGVGRLWRCICRLFLGSLFRDSNWKKVQVAGLSRGKVGLRCWDYRSSTAPGLGWPFKAVSNYIPPGTCHCIQVAPARGWKDYLGQSHSLHPSAMPRKGLSCEPPAASDPSSWGKEMGAQACRGDLGSKPLHLFLTTNWEKTMSEGFSKKPRQEYYRCFDHRMNIPGI